MNTNLATLQQWALTCLPVLLDTAMKGLALLILAYLVTAAMKKAPAATRQLVWVLALCAMLAMPAVSSVLPSWRILPTWARLEMPTLQLPPREQPSSLQPGNEDIAAGEDPASAGPMLPSATIEPSTPPAETSAVAVTDPSPKTTPPAAEAQDPSQRWRFWISIAIIVWAVGVLVCLAPLLLGHLSLLWLSRRSKQIVSGPWTELLRKASAAVGIRREVVLLQSSREPMPMLWGHLRPKLLIPAQAESWSADRRWVVLLHELAHARRWDCTTKVLAHLACAVYWFNPLSWLAFRQLQNEAERACDDLVIAAGSEPADYAEHVLRIASGLQSSFLAAHSGIALARRSNLEGRLLAILDGRRNRRALTRLGLMIAAILVAGLMIPISIMKATAADEKKDATAPATQPAKPGLGIYLITGQPKNDIPLEKVPLADFTLADDPLIRESDIFQYDWESHTIRLKQQAVADRILKRKGGAFVVVANGQRLYAGVMISMISSLAPKAPVINVGPTAGQFQPQMAVRIFPPPITGTPDPRSDARLKEALQALPVWVTSDTVPATAPATQPAIDARQTSETFLELVLAGKDPEAAKLAVPESAVARQLADIRKLTGKDKPQVESVLADQKRAIAVCREASDDRGNKGKMILHLIVRQGQWQVNDIDFDDAERTAKRIADFAKQNPGAKPISPATQPAGDGGGARTEVEAAAYKLLAALQKDDLPAAKALCEGDRMGWKDDSYGPKNRIKDLAAPAGLDSRRLVQMGRTVQLYFKSAKDLPDRALKTYEAKDEAVLFFASRPRSGRFIGVTLRRSGEQWLVHDIEDVPNHMKLIGLLDLTESAQPEPPRSDISYMQMHGLYPGAVLDLDQGGFGMATELLKGKAPIDPKGWEVGRDGYEGGVTVNFPWVRLLPLEDARDFVDACRLARQRMGQLLTSGEGSLPKGTRFFSVATLSNNKQEEHRLAVVEVLPEREGVLMLAWTCQKVSWPRDLPAAKPFRNPQEQLDVGLQILNNQFQLYAVQHEDRLPGLNEKGEFDGRLLADQLTRWTDNKGIVGGDGRSSSHPFGPYLKEMPANPFVADSSKAIAFKGGAGAAPRDGSSGWWLDTKDKMISPNHLSTTTTAPATQPASSTSAMQVFSGRVVDRQGKPVDGAQVNVMYIDGDHQVHDAWQGSTGADGAFSCRVGADYATVMVSKPGFFRAMRGDPVSVAQPATITLSRDLIIRGKVIDAATGKPIKQFTLVPGLAGSDKPDAYVVWDRSAQAQAQLGITAEGQYQWRVRDWRPARLRVEAFGYQAAESRTFVTEEGYATADFRLKPVTPVMGTVVDAQGKPVVGAEVFVQELGGQQLPYISRLGGDSGATMRSVSDGHFWVASQRNYYLFIQADQGTAILTQAQFEKSPRVTLKPWGGPLSGQVVAGGTKGADQTISALWEVPSFGLTVERTAQTDAEGKFTIRSVPAGFVAVGRKIRFEKAYTAVEPFDHAVVVDVQPGQQSKVTVGGGGRPVVGRAVLPAGCRVNIKDTFAWCEIRPAIERPELFPKQFAGEDPLGKYLAWLGTAAGKAYAKVDATAKVSYAAEIGPDGSFRVEDVPPGKYDLRIQAYGLNLRPSWGMGKKLGLVQTSIEIPAAPAEKPNQAVDLGVLQASVALPGAPAGVLTTAPATQPAIR